MQIMDKLVPDFKQNNQKSKESMKFLELVEKVRARNKLFRKLSKDADMFKDTEQIHALLSEIQDLGRF